MNKARVRNKDKGDSTSNEVIPSASHMTGLAARYNNNNAWYLTVSSGGVNNNNTNNRYSVRASRELSEIREMLFAAEASCWKNKHSSFDAARYHYHISRINALACQIWRREYEVSRSICFIITYPVPREVFASDYVGRVAHHLVAPYIQAVAERVHRANGNVSHGNRVGYSAHTAALQIQERMKAHPDGMVGKFDIQGFFMSTDRQTVLDAFRHYESMYPPEGFSESYVAVVKYLIPILILSNPTDRCVRHSSEWMWGLLPKHKSLFTSGGKGMPIGNFYVQLTENLLLATVDEALGATHFVDDYVIVDGVSLSGGIKVLNERLSACGLRLHPKKRYIQPVRHGVKFCGRVIYKDRIYISNRVVRMCEMKIDAASEQPSEMTAKALRQSVNSYFGIMKHCYARNIQLRLADKVLKAFGEWLYFKDKGTQLVCVLKKRYEAKHKSKYIYKHLIEYHHESSKARKRSADQRHRNQGR